MNNSIILGNTIIQKLGSWSYSIYLWHWPLVVATYYFSLESNYIYLGIVLSIILGYLSNKYIEKRKFNNNFSYLICYLKCKPLYIAVAIGTLGSTVFLTNGFFKYAPTEYQYLITEAVESPYRDKCHIAKYREPGLSCEYFGAEISWATLGDSHSTEISYTLAEKLRLKNIGLKEFSFSGCRPSYKESHSFSICAKWYNESIDYILKDVNIENIVLSHRFTAMLFNSSTNIYSGTNELEVSEEVIRMTNNLDELITKMATYKNKVYVYYPIPELSRNIDKLIGSAMNNKESLTNIADISLEKYKKRNRYIINHFDSTKYPSNVHFINPTDAFCDSEVCYAVKDGIPLYFDDNHPSMLGATKLIELVISD
ncbi:acyltransferase family protein [Pseudoalteromonas sp. B28]